MSVTDPSELCRCGCPENAHTGAWGIPTACTGTCGCSYHEPNTSTVHDTEPGGADSGNPFGNYFLVPDDLAAAYGHAYNEMSAAP